MATATQRRRKMRQRQHYAKAHRFQNVGSIADRYAAMSLKDLRKEAAHYSIAGRSKMDRDELITALTRPMSRRSALISS